MSDRQRMIDAIERKIAALEAEGGDEQEIEQLYAAMSEIMYETADLAAA